MLDPGFDSIATDYDEQFTHSAVGRLQRAVVHDFLRTKIRPGATKALEFNCGTGEDALWLARQGCSVRATDLSAEMVAITAQKAAAAGLGQQIETEVLDLRSAQTTVRYDLVLSNFGGLNCLPPTALQQFGTALPKMLRPGGCFIGVVMGRFCLWETSYFLWKRQLQQAARRWKSGPVQAALDAHTQVPTWYYAPAEFRAFFPGLTVRTIQPVGFWLPPSYLNPWFSRRPGFLNALNFLEKKCRGRMWAAAADHFMVVLERE